MAALVLHDRVKTPIAFVELVRLLASTFGDVVGTGTEAPPAELVATAAGIVGIENGGGLLVFNNNLGNLSAASGDVYAQPHPLSGAPSYFLSFETPEDGAREFWKWWLYRYRDSALAGLRGNAELAARELYRLGYVAELAGGPTAADYQRGLRAFYRKAWPTALAVGAPREVSAGTAAGVVAGSLGALGALGALLRGAA